MNSNITPENITLNSCHYTPVYLIQNNSITQARSYVLAPPKKEEQRPVTNNLKLFYENSGSIENGVVLNNVQYVTSAPAPKPLQEPPGNNLKLASFLVPKKDANKQQYIATITNKILKPTVSSSDTNVLPNINIIPLKVNGGARNKPSNAPRTLLKPRILPKITPKEKNPEPAKHTSVQLLKLGKSYHSLNQLSPSQMRVVSKALENIRGDPERTPLKPTYDADSNTKIIYKIVSPNDLKVVGNNRIVLKSSALKKDDIEIEPNAENAEKPESDEGSDPATEHNEVQVTTRSGRAVKLPKHIQQTQEDPPPKTRKKTHIYSCLTCSMEFPSLYRLQRHYDNRPGHIPGDSHKSLFHCLLAMTHQHTRQDKASMFLKQLEEFVAKLRELLPCLLTKMEGGDGTTCDIGDFVGRLFGVDPGKYELNMDALGCAKDKDGHCQHNPKPAPLQFTSQPIADLGKPSQLWLSKHQQETAHIEQEGEDCARINSVDKWAKKRVWKHKLEKTESIQANKKVKLNSDSAEYLIELGSETGEAPETVPEALSVEDREEETVADECRSLPTLTDSPIKTVEEKRSKGSHKQFYSTHFDIRSSPIKPSSTIFNKFQIVPEKMPLKFEAQLLRPLTFEQSDQTEENVVQNSSDNSLDLNGIFKELSPNTSDPIVSQELPNGGACKETDVLNNISFGNTKQWTLGENTIEAEDSCIKPNSLLSPAMMHVKNVNSTFNDSTNFSDNAISNNDNSASNNDLMEDSRLSPSQGVSVLNFLETLGNELTCPETELRNNSIDFPLDLFSFNHA